MDVINPSSNNTNVKVKDTVGATACEGLIVTGVGSSVNEIVVPVVSPTVGGLIEEIVSIVPKNTIGVPIVGHVVIGS